MVQLDRDSPFEVDARTMISLGIIIAVGAIASASGVGGGAIFIPLLNALVGFDLKSSTSLSQACITCGAAASLAVNLMRPHPSDPRATLVDFSLAAVLTPSLLMGVGAGVLLNVMLPSWLLTVLLLALLMLLVVQTVHKGRTLWRLETQHRQHRLHPHPSGHQPTHKQPHTAEPRCPSGSRTGSSNRAPPWLRRRTAAGPGDGEGDDVRVPLLAGEEPGEEERGSTGTEFSQPESPPAPTPLATLLPDKDYIPSRDEPAVGHPPPLNESQSQSRSRSQALLCSSNQAQPLDAGSPAPWRSDNQPLSASPAGADAVTHQDAADVAVPSHSMPVGAGPPCVTVSSEVEQPGPSASLLISSQPPLPHLALTVATPAPRAGSAPVPISRDASSSRVRGGRPRRGPAADDAGAGVDALLPARNAALTDHSRLHRFSLPADLSSAMELAAAAAAAAAAADPSGGTTASRASSLSWVTAAASLFSRAATSRPWYVFNELGTMDLAAEAEMQEEEEEARGRHRLGHAGSRAGRLWEQQRQHQDQPQWPQPARLARVSSPAGCSGKPPAPGEEPTHPGQYHHRRLGSGPACIRDLRVPIRDLAVERVSQAGGVGAGAHKASDSSSERWASAAEASASAAASVVQTAADTGELQLESHASPVAPAELWCGATDLPGVSEAGLPVLGIQLPGVALLRTPDRSEGARAGSGRPGTGIQPSGSPHDAVVGAAMSLSKQAGSQPAVMPGGIRNMDGAAAAQPASSLACSPTEASWSCGGGFEDAESGEQGEGGREERGVPVGTVASSDSTDGLSPCGGGVSGGGLPDVRGGTEPDEQNAVVATAGVAQTVALGPAVGTGIGAPAKVRRHIPVLSIAALAVSWGVYFGFQVIRNGEPRCSAAWWTLLGAQEGLMAALSIAGCALATAAETAAIRREAAAAAAAAAAAEAANRLLPVPVTTPPPPHMPPPMIAEPIADATAAPTTTTSTTVTTTLSTMPIAAPVAGLDGRQEGTGGGKVAPSSAAVAAPVPEALLQTAQSGKHTPTTTAPASGRTSYSGASSGGGSVIVGGSGGTSLALALVLRSPAAVLCATCAAGLAGGLLGLGGGMVMGPLLLHLGVQPQVTAATSGAMVLFSSSAALIQFAMMGRLNGQYALVFGAASAAASLVGSQLLGRAVKASGRPSLVVLALAAVMASGACCVAAFGLAEAFAEMRGGGGEMPGAGGGQSGAVAALCGLR